MVNLLGARWRQRICLISLGLLLGIPTFRLVGHVILLPSRAASPIEAVLVLGGSIQREIAAAAFSHQHPDIPILISHGSPDRCLLRIFQKAQAPLANIWIEKCARSTFENFAFSMPLLQRWQIRKVKLITSPTHLPRAQWLAQILLGAQGIWVEPDLVQERGIPANRESAWKTTLDVSRSLLWAWISQIYAPTCPQVFPLTQVDRQPQQGPAQCERITQGFESPAAAADG